MYGTSSSSTLASKNLILANTRRPHLLSFQLPKEKETSVSTIVYHTQQRQVPNLSLKLPARTLQPNVVYTYKTWHTPRETWRKIVKFDRVVQDDSSRIMGARYVWVAAWRKLSSSRKLVRLVPFAVVDKIDYIVRVRKFIQFIERSANKIVKLIPTTAFLQFVLVNLDEIKWIKVFWYR